MPEPEKTRPYGNGHQLFTTAHPDAPDAIKDRNGEVVLDLCCLCGRGEIELTQSPECDWRLLFGKKD